MFSYTGIYAIRSVDKQRDIPAINALLEQYHQSEETMFKCLLSRRALNTTELTEITANYRRIVESMLMNFPCLVAVYTPNNEIVGVNVMNISENLAPPKEPSKSESLLSRCCCCGCDKSIERNEKYSPKLSLLGDYQRRRNYMINDAELHVRYPNAKSRLEFYAVVVNAKHRRLGIATTLLREGMKIAWDNGVDIVFGLFTTPMSQLTAKKAGMTTIDVWDLMNYFDEDGAMIFADSIPYHFVEMLVATAELGSSTREVAMEFARLMIRVSAESARARGLYE